MTTQGAKMPMKNLILSATITNQNELVEKMAVLHFNAWCTQSQVSSMISTMRSYLPCLVRVYSRTPKNTAYLHVIGEKPAAFVISPRAKVKLVVDLSD